MPRTVALVLSALVAASAMPTAARVTVDDLMKLRTIVDVEISPDGRSVAYAVSTPSLERNAHEVALFVVPATGGAPTPVAHGSVLTSAPSLRWSPDGRTISFLATAAGRTQVYEANPSTASEAPKPITNATTVIAYEWAPDGKSIAYVSPEALSADETRQQQDPSFVIHADAPERPARLWIKALDGSAPRVVSPSMHFVDSLSWAPDSKEIVYSASTKLGFMGPYFTRIYAVSPDGGTPRTVVDRPGMNTKPQVSRDGSQVAFISTGGKLEIMASRSLNTAPLHFGAPVTLRTYVLDDAWVNEFVWSADSTSIFLQANDGTFGRGEHMFEQAIVRLNVADGRAEPVVAGPTVNYAPSLAADGKRLAYRSVESRTMGDVFVMDLETKRAAKLTDTNPELRNFALGDLKPVKWRSSDGFEIWGLLLSPPDATPGAKLPLIVYCHGGPGGGVTYGIFPQFMHIRGQVDPYPSEAMASAGMAVLFPMPRGGAGYGEAGQRAITNAWGEVDYRDIMTGVDALVAQGIADPNRLGVMGASYGGYMTNWIVTQTSRFKAASAGASLADLTDMYYLSEGGDFIAEYFGKPWENRDSYLAHSPLTFAKNVTTPLLIQHGERDPRVPVAEAWKFYRALKAMGKTVELDIHPRGGHVLNEPVQERAAMQRNLEWFTKWLAVAQPSPDRPFVIEFPKGFDTTNVFLSTAVTGAFGGHGRSAPCAHGKVAANECVIETVADGKEATTLKAVFYAPGYGLEFIDVPSLLNHPGRITIQPRRLGTVRLSGRILLAEGEETLAGREMRVLYNDAGEVCRFFKFWDCILQTGGLVARVKVQADLSFSCDVPDFGNDDGLIGHDAGQFQFFVDGSSTGSIQLTADRPNWSGGLHVAQAYGPIVLRPVKR
jgi:dipeptidyl aminopeptidase/acylaminoacyl peptidase